MSPMTIVSLGCVRYNQMLDDIRVNLRLKLGRIHLKTSKEFVDNNML